MKTPEAPKERGIKMNPDNKSIGFRYVRFIDSMFNTKPKKENLTYKQIITTMNKIKFTPIPENIELKDWFAGIAMQGVLSGNDKNELFEEKSDLPALAELSYIISDAMLKEKKKRTEFQCSHPYPPDCKGFNSDKCTKEKCIINN